MWVAALLATLIAPAHAYKAYVSNEKGNSITVLDTEKLEATSTVKVGRRPRGIALNKDGSELYICAGDDDAIQVLDTKTLKIIGNNGSSDGLTGIKTGREAATVQVDAVGWGIEQAKAAYSLITKQNL
ncbi:MAG: hypothetical protein ACXW3J_00865, partial [Methylocystis sp.]